MKNKLKVVTNFCFRNRDCRGAERCFVAVAIVDEVSSPTLSQPEQNNEGSTECVRNPEKPGFCVAKSRPKNQLEKYKRLSNIILLIIMRAVFSNFTKNKNSLLSFQGSFFRRNPGTLSLRHR